MLNVGRKAINIRYFLYWQQAHSGNSIFPCGNVTVSELEGHEMAGERSHTKRRP